MSSQHHAINSAETQATSPYSHTANVSGSILEHILTNPQISKHHTYIDITSEHIQPSVDRFEPSTETNSFIATTSKCPSILSSIIFNSYLNTDSGSSTSIDSSNRPSYPKYSPENQAVRISNEDLINSDERSLSSWSEPKSPTYITLQNVKPIIIQGDPTVDYRLSPINSGESDAELSDYDPTYKEEPVTLQNVEPIIIQRVPTVDYRLSPINSGESDAELSDYDPTYKEEPVTLQNVEPIIIQRVRTVDYWISPINSGESDAELSDNDPTYKEEPVTLQNVEPIIIQRVRTVDYRISPINSGESEAELSDNDPTYKEERVARQGSWSTSSNSLSIDAADITPADDISARTVSRKQIADSEQMEKIKQRAKRNSGEQYFSFYTKKLVPARKMKPPCSRRCRLKCSQKINYDKRMEHFKSFWALGNLQRQHIFIASSMAIVAPKYKHSNTARLRDPKRALYFNDGNEKIRVCKKFFINTLGISRTMVQTVRYKCNKGIYTANSQREEECKK